MTSRQLCGAFRTNPLIHFRTQDNPLQRFGLDALAERSEPTLSYSSALRTTFCRDSAWALPGPTKNFPEMPRLRNPRENMHQEAHKVDFGAPSA